MHGTRSKNIIVLEVNGGGFPDNKLMYLGAHMMNDPMLDILPGKKDKNAYNVKISHNLALVAEKIINIGDEILGNYNFHK